jgi:hypothetical protein
MDKYTPAYFVGGEGLPSVADFRTDAHAPPAAPNFDIFGLRKPRMERP